MKALTLGFLLLGFAVSTLAADKAELDNRLRSLTAKLESLQNKPDKRIPAENLRKAQGIILLDRTKAGFIFAFQGGGGVALVKDAKSEKWGVKTQRRKTCAHLCKGMEKDCVRAAAVSVK